MLKQGNEYPTNNVLFVLAESEVGFDAIPPNTSQIIIILKIHFFPAVQTNKKRLQFYWCYTKYYQNRNGNFYFRIFCI